MGDLNFTPRTWSGMVTGAQMNGDIRDPWEDLQAPWVDYTPTWTAATTNPSLGNGTIDASFHRTGKTVTFIITVTMGSTTTYGAGQWRITLPFTAAQTKWRAALDMQVGSGFYGHTARASTTTYLALFAAPTTAGNADRQVGAASPGTWTTGDSFTITGTYEAV